MPKKTKKGKDRLDKFYHLAKDQGYRARSAFKLIQLAKKQDFLSKARVCIDLCAAPGGWSQVAQRNMPVGSQIIAIDLMPIKPIHGVTCIQSDITTERCRSILRREMKGQPADVVLHDGAPNVGSNWAKDAYMQNELTLHSAKLACEFLRPGGTFVTKVFRSSDYNSLLWVFNQLFNKVEATKPTASRNVSAEIFVMCIGFKAGKIDPRFFDSKWVFMEALEAPPDEDEAQKKPSAALSDHLRSQKKRHRGGYEEGDDLRVIAAHDFVASLKPADVLVTHHRINLQATGSEQLLEHPLTTTDIKELCNDLKVLGKRDLGSLLKWRMKIIRERERAERAARKAAEEAGKALATQGKAKKAPQAVPQAATTGGQQDLDDAIAELLDGTPPKPTGGEAEAEEASGSEAEAAEEELERELTEQVEKRRRADRKEQKKMMERQKKAEWRKKMSLHSAKMVQDQPELWRATPKSLQAMEALENGEAYVNPEDIDADESEIEDEAPPVQDSDSDEGLDRLARMEVDIAVDMQLRKMRMEDKHRATVQRANKKKKETRRQRVMAAWAGELSAFNDQLDQQAAADHALRDKDPEDDDDSELDLQELREYQNFLTSSGKEGVDSDALQALAEGPDGDYGRAAAEARIKADKGADADGEEDDDEEPANEALALEDSKELAEDTRKADNRAARWFSQDIFKGLSSSSSATGKIIPLDRDSDVEASDGDDQIREVDESQLPKLPLTDKERRKLKRKKDKERLEKLGKKPKLDEAEKGPLEIAPMEPPKPLVPASKFEKPTDPKELAETLALGSLLVESKKSRMELIDAAYNRYTFDLNPALPDWFTEDEDKHNRPELPISRELMNQFRAKLREINARPIRKVAEARARKKRRLQKRLEKLRSTAMSLADSGEMSETAKARQMRRAMNKLAKQDQRKVTTVAIKKGGGGKRMERGKVPKGAKVKIVDKRMKSDRRGEKKAAKRNKAGHKLQQKKVMQKKSLRRGAGGPKGGGAALKKGKPKQAKGSKGIHGDRA